MLPDLADELHAIDEARRRLRATVHRRIERERELMAGLPERMRAALHSRLSRESAEG